jgi:hypothetical protein
MTSTEDNQKPDVKLEIAFPRSDKDYRIQLVKINNSIFAIVHSPLESQGPIHLDCPDWSLVLLSPIKSKVGVEISAINLICLNTIESQESNIKLNALNRLVKFGEVLKPSANLTETAEGGVFHVTDELGSGFYFHQLFHGIIKSIHSDTPEAVSEAQQDFITCLCAVAGKMEKTTDLLDLQKVLNIWNIA